MDFFFYLVFNLSCFMNSEGHFSRDPPLIPVSCVMHTFMSAIVCHLDYDSNNQQGVI